MDKLTVIAIDANFDEATQPPGMYRQANVYPAFDPQRFTLQHFHDSTAVREALIGKVEAPIALVTGSGYGTRSSFAGFHTFTIFSLHQDQMDEPKGKIVHLLACETAAALGFDFIKHGCEAFFGYADTFIYSTYNETDFFECDSTIDLLLAQGLKAKDVYEKARRFYTEKAAALKTRPNLQTRDLYDAANLEKNRDSLTLIGNSEASLYPSAAIGIS